MDTIIVTTIVFAYIAWLWRTLTAMEVMSTVEERIEQLTSDPPTAIPPTAMLPIVLPATR